MVVFIGKKQISCAVDGHSERALVQPGGTPVGRNPRHSVVIGCVKVAEAIDRQTAGGPYIVGGEACVRHCRYGAVGRDPTNSLILRIGDQEIAGGVYRDGGRIVCLQRPTALCLIVNI